MERREHPRFQARFDALCATGDAEGAGVIANISYTGARVAESTLKPELGTKVRLYIFIQPVSPFELSGEVIRHHEDGFAISYQIEDPDLLCLVDDVAAIVAAFE